MSDIIFSCVLILISGIWIAEGLRLGLWIPGVSAGSGFVPTVFAVVTLLSSIWVIVSAVRKNREDNTSADHSADADASAGEETEIPGKWEALKPVIPVVFAVGGLFSLQLFGLVITVFLISFLWMKFVSRLSTRNVIIFTVCITLFIYLVFEYWLRIPFPGDIINI